jgi:O-methyltransferase
LSLSLSRFVIQIADRVQSSDVMLAVLRHTPASWKSWLKQHYWKIRIKSGKGIVSTEGLTQKYREALLWLKSEDGLWGDYLEFGVFNGTSLSCMHRVTEELGLKDMRLFGFDSFAGLPETAEQESDGLWSGGSFQMDYAFTKNWLTQQGVDWRRVFLIPGWYHETLTQQLIDEYKLTKASVIMIDCDLYSSALEALDFCAPLIHERAVILFDDWFPLAHQAMGEKKAFDEFLAAHPDISTRDLDSYDPTSRVFAVLRNKSAATRGTEVIS